MAAAVSYRLVPAIRNTPPGAYPPSADSTAPETTLAPPRITIRSGWRRVSSVFVADGIVPAVTSRTGAAIRPATAAAASASGKFAPVATKTTGARGENDPAE